MRRPHALLPFAFLLLLAASSSQAFARKEYKAESYSTDIQIDNDGSLLVRESVRVRFSGGPFTFFYRGIPSRHSDGITLIAASDSTKLKKRRTGLDVTWRFPATRDTVRDFIVTYRVLGALRKTERGYRFDWHLFPGDRAYSIEHASARVMLPSGSTEEQHQVHPHALSLHRDGNDLVLDPVALEPERTVRIHLEMTAAGLQASTPGWEKRQETWARRAPLPFALGAILLMAGLATVLRMRMPDRRARAGASVKERAREIRRARTSVIEPPERISPALAGALRDANVTAAHAIAGLIDLAERGIVRFDQEEKHSRWSRPRPILHRLDTAISPRSPRPELEPWEIFLLDAAFSKSDERNSARWSQVESGLARNLKEFSLGIHRALLERGDLDPEVAEARARLQRWSLFTAMISLPFLSAAALLYPRFGPAALVPAGAVLLVALLAALVSQNLAKWSAQGAERAEAWRGFTRHLKESAKRGSGLDQSRFHGWLAYAVALGASKEWLAAGKRRGYAVPTWFRAAAAAATDLDDLSIFVAASAGGAAGAGGGGAGGGGSSGAG